MDPLIDYDDVSQVHPDIEMGSIEDAPALDDLDLPANSPGDDDVSQLVPDEEALAADRGPDMGEAAGGERRYDHLADRALSYIRDRRSAVHEDVLIAHVFGNSGHVAMWRPLIRQVLSAEAEVVLSVDGYWSTAGRVAIPGDHPLNEFVALDVETTGLRPLHQRITEVAAIRFKDGVVAGRYSSLVNPERRIPLSIAKLTGITDADVAGAPLFAAVADPLLDFLGHGPVVGHNVRFDMGFVNAELKRVGKPPLGNATIDTVSLAHRLIPGLRKPTLERVAKALGLVPGRLHRAEADAELTGLVADRLARGAVQQGFEGERLEALFSAPAARKPRDRAGRDRAPLDRSILADIPKRSGVYVMRDRQGTVIYVGKAKNLRDRVGSYFSQAIGYTRKMDGLLDALTTIDVEVTGSELEALLLEAQLIRRYQPRYNTAMRSFEHYPFIRVDVANPWPRITLAKARKDDGSAYFGPFRNKTGARKTVDLINDVLPLRTCTRSFRDARSYGAPCIQLDLGKCLGPCMGVADPGEYRGLVRDVVRFLDGQDEVLYERLWHGLEQAAERQDFERARKLRNDITSLTHVVQAHGILRDAVENHTLALVLPGVEAGMREVFIVIAGQIWSRSRVADDDRVDAAGRLGASWQRARRAPVRELDHHAIDEANILNRWLHQHAGHPAIVPLRGTDPDWPGIVSLALSLPDDCWTGWQAPGEAGEDEQAVILDSVPAEMLDEPAVSIEVKDMVEAGWS
ncbi:MAG: GIY-YIG nuclease family protein [Chloroflexia bacterium]|nr:GIY-YIG nuclease family protein [Chloroflexia bacterium]